MDVKVVPRLLWSLALTNSLKPNAEASFDGDSSTMLDKMEEEAITNMCDNQEALAAIAKASAGTSTNEKRRAAPRKMRVQFDL